MSLEILKDQIKKNSLQNLYLFYGPEDYLKKHYIEQIEKLLIDESMKDMNMVIVDGKTDAGLIISNCETMPFFAEKKLVIVKNSGLFKPSKKESEEKSSKAKAKTAKKLTAAEEISEYLKKLPDHVCLIFYEEEVDKRLKLLDAIKKNGLIVEFPLQKPIDIIKWAMKFIKSNGKEISHEDAAYLIENSEPYMTDVMNELKKLVQFCGDRQLISINDILKVCTRTIHGRIFDLMDAIVEKNVSLALKLLDDMVVLKEPIPKILFMVAKQFRQMYEMKLLKEEGITSNVAAGKMGISPYTATKLINHCTPFSKEKIKKAMELCVEMDEAIKTGLIKDRIATELIISTFSNV